MKSKMRYHWWICFDHSRTLPPACGICSATGHMTDQCSVGSSEPWDIFLQTSYLQFFLMTSSKWTCVWYKCRSIISECGSPCKCRSRNILIHAGLLNGKSNILVLEKPMIFQKIQIDWIWKHKCSVDRCHIEPPPTDRGTAEWVHVAMHGHKIGISHFFKVHCMTEVGKKCSCKDVHNRFLYFTSN